MPVAIGFHPYFQLTDSPRDAWTISIGARTEWLLAPDKIPTGETRPIERLFTAPGAAPLKDYDLDHVFGDLIRDASGRAVMSVKGRSQRIDVAFGPNYRAAVVYAPSPDAPNPNAQNRNFICFEPMASHHRRAEPDAAGSLQGAAEHCAGPDVERAILDPPERVLTRRQARATWG